MKINYDELTEEEYEAIVEYELHQKEHEEWLNRRYIGDN
jgi:hypothetical protein